MKEAIAWVYTAHAASATRRGRRGTGFRATTLSALNELRDPTLREAAVRPGETERKSRKTVDQTGVGMSVD